MLIILKSSHNTVLGILSVFGFTAFCLIFQRAKSLKLKKEEGNVAFKADRFEEAYNLYTEALLLDPHNGMTNAKLHFNKATVAAKVMIYKK